MLYVKLPNGQRMTKRELADELLADAYRSVSEAKQTIAQGGDGSDALDGALRCIDAAITAISMLDD